MTVHRFQKTNVLINRCEAQRTDPDATAVPVKKFSGLRGITL